MCRICEIYGETTLRHLIKEVRGRIAPSIIMAQKLARPKEFDTHGASLHMYTYIGMVIYFVLT